MRQFYCVVSVIFIILSLLMLSNYIEIAQGFQSNTTITVPYSVNTPNIDGKWTTSTEWTDASEYKLPHQGSTAYIRTKQNSSYLFILIDFISDQTGSGSDSISTFDYSGLFFDTLNDGGNYPKSDDYFLSHYYISTYAKSGLQTYVSQGTGNNKEENNWTEIAIPQGFVFNRGFSATNDPYESSKSHRLFEASLPLEIFGNHSTVGFYLFSRDANAGILLQYPANAGGESTRSDSMSDTIAPAPERWGNLFFAPISSSPTPVTTYGVLPTPTSMQNPSPWVPISVNQLIFLFMIAVGIAVLVLLIMENHKRKASNSTPNS